MEGNLITPRSRPAPPTRGDPPYANARCNRDAEFEPTFNNRADLLARWELGWSRLFATIDGLLVSDLGKTVAIRSVPHTVPQALQRALVHCAYHVGQIVLLAKHAKQGEWKNLSVPKGGSAQHNREVATRHGK